MQCVVPNIPIMAKAVGGYSMLETAIFMAIVAIAMVQCLGVPIQNSPLE